MEKLGERSWPVITCPCCGYRVISDTYEICQICAWEYDPVQSERPDITGANRVTLREAQKNFREFGASDRDLMDMVQQPSSEDERDPDWRPLDPAAKPQT